MHADLFADFGGWASPQMPTLGADCMRQFMNQDAKLVASFVHACELRASDVVFHAFDVVLEVPGFFPGPP
jgi:hypothetical protein